MANESSKVEVSTEINVKDNASTNIDKVTSSLEKLGLEVIEVEDLLKNLAKNVKTSFEDVKKTVSGIDNKTIEAMKTLRQNEMIDVDKSRSRAKSTLDRAKASEIKSRENAGYYEAEAQAKRASAQHDDKALQIAIEKNTGAQIKANALITASLERTKQSENRVLAAEKQLENTLVKKPYWDITTKIKSSDLYMDDMRSRMIARDIRTKMLMEGVSEKDNRIGFRRTVGGGINHIAGELSNINTPSGITKTVSGVVQSFGKIVQAATPVGMAFAGFTEAVKGGTKVFNEAMESFQNVEVIKTNLGVISGSKIEGESLFSDIAKYAVKSPFGVQQTAEQATLLKQSGVYAEDLMNTLKMVGDLAGGNADKMRRISNDYAQIVSNGKANMLQLRQFANAGVPIYKELSKELNISNEAVRKMVKNGEIGASTIEKILKNLTSEGGTFYQAVEKGAKTLKARTTNLADVRTLAFSEIGRDIIGKGRDDYNTSVLENMLEIQEKFFNWVYEIGNEKNNKEDLNNLLKNEKELKKKEAEYEALLKSSDLSEDIAQRKYDLAVDIQKLRDAYSDEDKQAILFNTYQDKIKDVNFRNNGIMAIQQSIFDMKGRLEKLQEEYNKADVNDYYNNTVRYYDIEGLKNAIFDAENLYNESLGRNENRKNEITASMYESAFKSYFDSAFKSSSEILEKGTKKDKSLWLISDEMANLYKQTAEYKEKELEEQKQLFLTVKATANELSRLTKEIDGETVLDISKISSAAEFKKYAQLLSSGDKFNLEQSSYNPINEKDIERANEVNAIFQESLINALRIARTAESDIKNNASFGGVYNKLSSLTGKHFLNDSMSFNRTFDEYKEMIDDLSNGNGSEKSIADFFKGIINPIITGTITTNTKAKDYDVSELFKETPLWARILGSGLGLDAERVKNAGGGASLRLHEEEQYTRNITKALLGSGAKNGMNTYALMGMVQRTPGVYKSDKDGIRNLQINWKETSNNFKKFALELGQAANITSAYREVVENEVNTLSDLLANMPTTFEDVKNSKSFTDQFLNVFTGEVTYNGKTAYYDSQTKMITTLDGNTMAIYDVMDKIDFAETTMQELVKQLDKRREELVEAKRVEAINSIFEEGKQAYRESTYGYIAEAMGIKAGSSQYKNFIRQGSISDVNQTWASYYGWTPEERAKVKAAEESDAKSVAEKENARQRFVNAKALSETTKGAIEKYWESSIINLAYKQIPGFSGDYKSIEGSAKTLEGYQDAVKDFESYKKSIEDAKNSLKSLEEEYQKLEITTTAATVKQEQLASKLLDNATSFKDVLKLSMQIYQDPLLTNQDNDVNEFSRYLDVKDITAALAYNNYGKRNERNSGYFTDRFYNAAYGYSKYDVESITKGRSIDTQALLATKGLLGAGIINDTTGTQYGARLLELYNNKQTDSDEWNEIMNSITKKQLSKRNVESQMETLKDSMSETFDSYMLDNFNDALVTTGSSLRNIIDCLSDGSDAWGNFGKAFVESTKSLTANMGSLMTTAGLKLLINGEASERGQAFALLAAGGLASVISGFMSAGQDDTDEKIRKLDKLKSDLKDLIQQAKADAIYYESNLSHKKALTTGRTVANYSVNDAIITPNGNVISTHPDDYLIATKTPGSLGKSAAPIINLNIQNNTGSQVQIKQTRNEANGQINIEAVLDNAINQGLADGRFDSGMAARERRLRGNVVYQ